MAPLNVSKSTVPQSLHEVYDSFAKKGGDIKIVDGDEVQLFAKEVQRALDKGTIDKNSVINMGYSCDAIRPSEFGNDDRRTWEATYSSKAQRAAEDAAFKILKYTNPILHKLASNNVTVGKAVKFIPGFYAGFAGWVVGIGKDITEAFTGPSYKVY